MIGPIQNNGAQRRPQQRPLTEDQRSRLQSIVDNYGVEVMGKEDDASLKDELRSSGIGPSSEVRGILEEAGFDMEALRPKGPPPGMGGPGGPPPGMGGPPPGIPEGLSSAMMSFVEKYENGELSEEDVASLVEELKNSGLERQGVLLDVEG